MIVLTQWLIHNQMNLTMVGIILGYTLAVWFLTWLVTREVWKRNLMAHLPEITREKLRERDEVIFKLKQEVSTLTEQVAALSVQNRAALNFVHKAAEQLHAPAREIRIHKERKNI